MKPVTSEALSIEKKFAYLGDALIKKILEVSEVRTFPAGTELVREGQYIKVIPIVLSGLLKVITRAEDKELLLYYIMPEQSCIMSFSSGLSHEKSKIVAVAEEETTVLLIPADKATRWVTEYPEINTLFYKQYELRYTELIDTINHLLYDRLDKRLLDYLQERVKVTGKNPVKITHKEIANDLGTAREVISRLVKKLEKQQLLKQHHDSIEVLQPV